MARVFLDTNYYIDLTIRNTRSMESLKDHLLFISPLSTHILFYSQKVVVPDEKMTKLHSQFGVIPLNKLVLDKAMQGSTSDLEDNIQLHSAIEGDCDFFLTNDKKLLNMKFFGKMEIVHELPSQKSG